MLELTVPDRDRTFHWLCQLSNDVVDVTVKHKLRSFMTRPHAEIAADLSELLNTAEREGKIGVFEAEVLAVVVHQLTGIRRYDCDDTIRGDQNKRAQ